MKKSFFAVAILLVCCMFQVISCNSNEQSLQEKNIQQGFQLAQKNCSSCHLLPEPGLLNKVTWAQHVLPKMGELLGFRRFALDYIVEDDTATSISLEQWRNIVRYYVSAAPDNATNRTSSSSGIKMHLPNFHVIVPPTVTVNAATTLVSSNPREKQIVFGDGLTERLYTLSGNNIIDSIKLGVGISNVHSSDSGFFALTMGVLFPSDAKSGKLSWIDGKTRKVRVVLDSLQRPVHAGYADLNGDAREDIVVCEFGNKVGQLSWYERIDQYSFRKHILRGFPGSVKTEVYDFNKDGRPDIMALLAQGDEGFFIFFNEGSGQFREERVLRLSPSYGSNYFELADFNNDGYPDIVASNGDNGDYPPILKSYHGVRIYFNDRNNRFSEKVFLPVNGVGKVIAEDFDFDGDLDLASISYFPDYKLTPEESFIFWRNEGDLKFTPFSFPEASSGRWLTMHSDDIDADGDIDIVLGNAKFTVGAIPSEIMKKYEAFSPSIMILRNSNR
jgi:hypothetical protein